MKLNFTLYIRKAEPIKIGSFFMFLFFLSSCTVLKNAGIEQRKYRPGYFNESSSRKVIDTKKHTVESNGEPDLYCITKIHLPDKGMFETVQKKPNESLKQNVQKSKPNVLINSHISKFINTRAENVYTLKKQNVVFKDIRNNPDRPIKSDKKDYTLAQVLLFLIALFLLYGILTLLLMLFPIMSFAIALVISILIWIPTFIVIWLIFETIKEKLNKK